jgi:hypothetical protein
MDAPSSRRIVDDLQEQAHCVDFFVIALVARCGALISCAANSPFIISKIRRACCARSCRFFGPAVDLFCARFLVSERGGRSHGGDRFVAVKADYEHVHLGQNLSAWLEIVRRRDTCSQLQTISDAAYQAGLKR